MWYPSSQVSSWRHILGDTASWLACYWEEVFATQHVAHGLQLVCSVACAVHACCVSCATASSCLRLEYLLPVVVLSMCAGCKQSATKRGATTVLSTLVSNAREVFKVLAAQQLEDPTAAGVSFPMLLRVVRERYIITAEHALKSVLAEFRDHELIKFRAGPDGGEVMYIPMEEDMLRGALQDMQAAEAE